MVADSGQGWKCALFNFLTPSNNKAIDTLPSPKLNVRHTFKGTQGPLYQHNFKVNPPGKSHSKTRAAPHSEQGEPQPEPRPSEDQQN